jgi:hypothetical protein
MSGISARLALLGLAVVVLVILIGTAYDYQLKQQSSYCSPGSSLASTSVCAR